MPKAADLCKVAPKYLGVPYSKMDCQAFVEKCLSDIGIDDNLSGSNAWYRRMTWVGTPEECKSSFGDIPRGAFLFILKHDGKEPEKYKPDGIGNASHIGIYTGISGKEMCEMSGVEDALKFDHGNGAIHSSASRDCVCTSTFAGKAISGGWNRIGLWDALSYEMDFPIDSDGGEVMTATVFANSGGTVNMRTKPTFSAPLVDQVPVGDTVIVQNHDGEWSSILWHGKKGYMRSEYLKFAGEQPGQDQDDKSTITIERSRLWAVYEELGSILGVVG